MLMRTDLFRELDRLTDSMLDAIRQPAVMPMDCYRQDGAYYAQFDLPGVDADSIDVTVEQNVLTVKAERKSPIDDAAETIVSERPHGSITRRVHLGDSLDIDNMSADYDAGVLTIRIPVAEEAKPRKVLVSSGSDRKQISA